MNIEQLEHYQWFLAQYITGGRNREHLGTAYVPTRKPCFASAVVHATGPALRP